MTNHRYRDCKDCSGKGIIVFHNGGGPSCDSCAGREPFYSEGGHFVFHGDSRLRNRSEPAQAGRPFREGYGMTLDIAKERYARAWDEYRTCFDKSRARELEVEMDSAQNHFTFDQFQEFKVTLPGYVGYWNDLPRLALGRKQVTHE